MSLSDSVIKHAKGFLSQVANEANKYSSSNSPNYPSHNGQYPPQGSPYPPQGSPYAPPSSSYANQDNHYTPQSGPHPPHYEQYSTPQSVPNPTQQYQQGTSADQHPSYTHANPQNWHQPPPPEKNDGQPVYHMQSHGYPQQHSGPSSSQALPLAPQPPMALKFKETAHRVYSLVDLSSNQVHYTFRFSSSMSSKATAEITRGSNGPQFASVLFHTMTSSKADMNFNGREVQIKKSFQSITGQGTLEWKKEHKSFFSSKGNLILHDRGGPIAVFELDKGPGSYHRQGGAIEIQKQGLNQSQLDEIFISGVVELERNRLIAEATKVVSAAV